MFVKSIKEVSQFTRPIHSIMRTYSGEIIPGAATLFFINEDGYAITCKHVLELLLESNRVNANYESFKNRRSILTTGKKYNQKLKELEKEHGIADKNTIVQIKNCFLGCIETDQLKWSSWVHPQYDLAVIKFEDYNEISYNSYARFPSTSSCLDQGKFLCRIGHPFPEFTNYKFDKEKDDIEFTNNGNQSTPIFPIEGMVTRFIAAPDSRVFAIELSTPGLRGQSGGPLFDENGIIYGMQSMTHHLHLGFDLVKQDVVIDNLHKKVDDYAFLHLGSCIHFEIIKEFLTENSIKFYTA